MKIAIATIKVRTGRCEENFSKVLEKIEEAKQQQADMIVFGQDVITGYLLGDDWLDDAFCKYADSFNQRFIDCSEDIAIVWGNVRYRNQRRFQAAFFAYQKQTHMRVKKNEHMEYIDDGRYFENNPINSAIEFQDMVLALNFGNELQLADLNINIDAHPYDMDEQRVYKGNIVYANVCGMQNSSNQVKIMEGASYVYYHQKLLYEAPYFEEGMQLVDLQQQQEVKQQQPQLLDALLQGIKEFDESVLGGKLPWIVGLSGGLDSSVTAALLTMSLGRERVYAFNMPTGYNSTATMDNAQQEADALQIAYKKGSISSMLAGMQEQFLQNFAMDMDNQPSLVKENMQARMRGFVLNGLASMLQGVVVNNANMVETALGYCTLYGDSIGALSPIGDLSKERLFELSLAINERMGKEIVPNNLLPSIIDDELHWETMPSAELKDAQKDPMKWYYHDALLEKIRKGATKSMLVQAYQRGQLQTELGFWMAYYQLENEAAFLEDLDWLFSTMKRNAFKLLQLPPAITLHAKTIHGGIRSQYQAGAKEAARQLEILKKS